MTAKEYLGQAYRLDEKIDAEQREIDNLRRLAISLPSPQMGDKVTTSHPTEASFVQYVNALVDLEKDITAKIDRLVTLKVEITQVLDAVPDDDERLVLHMRYLDNFTWEQIAGELCVASSTVRRWHSRGLQHINIPDEKIL